MSSSSVRAPAMPLPTITSFIFFSVVRSLSRRAVSSRLPHLPAIEELEHRGTMMVIVRVLLELDAVARPRQLNGENSPDRGGRAVGQHHDAVGKQNRFVDIVRDD